MVYPRRDISVRKRVRGDMLAVLAGDKTSALADGIIVVDVDRPPPPLLPLPPAPSAGIEL